MITKLTESQKKLFKTYRDKWISIGLKTGPANRRYVESLVPALYKSGGLEAPKDIMWMPSPKAALDYINKKGYSDYRCYGQHDAGWLSFYAYMYEVLNIKEVEPLIPLMKLATEVGWFWCYDKLVIFSERPVKLSLNEQGQLHDEFGPAIVYSDGTCGYYINGVRMLDKFFSDCLPKDLPAAVIAETENVEMRRELVRLIGLDRVYKELGAEVKDKEGNYELITLNIGTEKPEPYLKMVNPSIKTLHLECVGENCTTVKEALAWRNGLDKFVQPTILT